MSNLFKIFLVLSLTFALGFIAFAQGTPTDEIEEAVSLDEDVEPEDLEVGEPRILPDHPLYFLKNLGRRIRVFFVLNPIAKAKLTARFANEKLIELRKMIEEGKDPEKIKDAAENYQEEMKRIKERVEKIKEKAKDNPEVEKFLDKFVKHQLLHERILQKLEEQVPDEAFEKIKEARERHLERFGEVMTKLEERGEKIRERLENKLEEIGGSKYKNFKNLEFLLELEKRMPEEAKEAIQRAQENALNRLRGDLEKMSPEDQEKFKEYLEKIGGIKETQLEILENLKTETPTLEEMFIQIRERFMERVREGSEK